MTRKDKGKPHYYLNLSENARNKIKRFGKDNPFYGKHHTKETKKKLSLANLGHTRNKGRKHTKEQNKKFSEYAKTRLKEKSANWKGDNAGYDALHKHVCKYLGKRIKCELCGSKKKLQWANKSGKYLRDLKDWICLCAKCHYHYDNRDGIIKKRFPNFRR